MGVFRWLNSNVRGAMLAVWIAIVDHVAWGVLLLVDQSPGGVTSIARLQRIVPGMWLPVLLLVVALSAVWGAVLGRGSRTGLVLMLPQQMVLVSSMIGAMVSIVTEQFADGVVRPWTFLLADQGVRIWIAVAHTLAILELHLSKRCAYAGVCQFQEPG